MQPRLFIIILLLQSKRLMRILVNPLVLFQTTPAVIIPESNQVAADVGHFSWDADLVAVEVVGLLAAFSVFIDRVSLGETAFMRATYTLRQDWRFHAGHSLLFTQQCFFK